MSSKSSKVPRRTFNLLHPFPFDGETIDKLEIRRAKGRDMRSMGQELSMGDLLDLAGKLSGVPSMVIDDLDGEDVMRLQGVMGELFGLGPAAGSAPSGPSRTASGGDLETTSS